MALLLGSGAKLYCRRMLTGNARSVTAAVALRSSHRCNSPGTSSLKTFGVVGCGQMGTGIAIVAARHAGLKVVALDGFEASLERSKEFLDAWITKEVQKGRMTEDSGKLMKEDIQYCNLHSSAANDIVPKLDFIVEAVNEELDIKEGVYKRLQEAGLSSDCILGTNTSSISITKLARTVERPERVIGMHFMNPVPVMKLVEVIRGLRTSDDTHAKTLELCTMMNKEPATSKDRPGFIANRILMANLNAAILTLQDDVATRDDIDKIMKLGTGVPMGPLQLADFIGLDTVLHILRVLHAEQGESYRPAPLLVNYVEAGWLGKKTKRGFYEY